MHPDVADYYYWLVPDGGRTARGNLTYAAL